MDKFRYLFPKTTLLNNDVLMSKEEKLSISKIA